MNTEIVETVVWTPAMERQAAEAARRYVEPEPPRPKARSAPAPSTAAMMVQVKAALRRMGDATHQELRAATGADKRAVYNAFRRLQSLGEVEPSGRRERPAGSNRHSRAWRLRGVA